MPQPPYLSDFRHARRWAGALGLVAIAAAALAQQASAQAPSLAFATPPSGVIQSEYAQPGYAHPCYAASGAAGYCPPQSIEAAAAAFQPIEIVGPPGTMVAMAENGRFVQPRPLPQVAGVLVGPLYRLRVSSIPNADGREVFPTVEVIHRMHAPRGQEARFPIPIELTAEDLRLALDGHFITRVVYLEDPLTALPAAEDPEHPAWFDLGPGVDPIEEARRLGRPVAILRLGGRLPVEQDGPDADFVGPCPPFAVYRIPPKIVAVPPVRLKPLPGAAPAQAPVMEQRAP
jgi:hypothetical protein